MTEVLLGQSYFLRFDPKLWDAMQPYPPLGTLYAASYLREKGHEVGLFDAMLAESEDEWGEAISRESPRFAVLFEDNFNYLSKMCLLRMRQAAFHMIAMATQRGCTVIVCGADASDHASEYLGKGANFVITGEGEVTLNELLNQLSGRSSVALNSIPGIIYYEGDRLCITPRRPDIKDLDDLPFPAWDLVDISRYRRIWIERHGYFSMNMVTTRGCPFHCNWCAKPIWGQRYNSRSPENVVAEMKWVYEAYRPDHIWFVDDILGLKPGWLERFADLLEAEGLHIPFKSLNRADLLLRGQTIPALARAGAQTIWIGAESGSQKVLDAMEKGTRIEQIYEAARRLHAASIQVGFFLQFGYPGENRLDIEKTLQMVRDCQPDDIGISVSYPLPGTKFYEAVRQQLGARQNWVDSQDLAMLYDGPFSTRFYRQLYKIVHKEFRLRKALAEFRQGVSEPRQYGLASVNRLVRAALHASTLPADRLILDGLAHLPHKGLDPLPVDLGPLAASQPTPQSDR